MGMREGCGGGSVDCKALHYRERKRVSASEKKRKLQGRQWWRAMKNGNYFGFFVFIFCN